MSDTENLERGIDDAATPARDEDFAPFNFPTTFADGVLSMAGGSPITKLFLYRVEPNVYGTGGFKTMPTAQIVMPIAGVINMKMFIDSYLDNLVENGQLDKEYYEKQKSSYVAPSYVVANKAKAE